MLSASVRHAESAVLAGERSDPHHCCGGASARKLQRMRSPLGWPDALSLCALLPYVGRREVVQRAPSWWHMPSAGVVRWARTKPRRVVSTQPGASPGGLSRPSHSMSMCWLSAPSLGAELLAHARAIRCMRVKRLDGTSSLVNIKIGADKSPTFGQSAGALNSRPPRNHGPQTLKRYVTP
jgi:hypothetical protein